MALFHVFPAVLATMYLIHIFLSWTPIVALLKGASIVTKNKHGNSIRYSGFPCCSSVALSHSAAQRMRNKRHGERYFIELPYESLRYYLMTDSLSKKIRHDCKIRNCESIVGREKITVFESETRPIKVWEVLASKILNNI